MAANGDGGQSKFIPDGYTIPFYIGEIPGVSRAVSGMYRPTAPEQFIRYGVRKQIINEDGNISREDRAVAVQFLDIQCACEGIKEWNLKPHNAKPDDPVAPISVESVARLMTVYQWQRLTDILNGGGPSDVNPLAAPSKGDDGKPIDPPSGDLDQAAGNSGAPSGS